VVVVVVITIEVESDVREQSISDRGGLRLTPN